MSSNNARITEINEGANRDSLVKVLPFGIVADFAKIGVNTLQEVRKKGEAREGRQEAGGQRKKERGEIWRRAIPGKTGCVPGGHQGDTGGREGTLPKPDSILAKLEFSVIIP